jgi:hypothetical protein
VRIRESKNLKLDLLPSVSDGEGGKIDPDTCILDAFERTDDKLVLYFKNRSKASIKGLGLEGGREIDAIETKMAGFIGSSYSEILNSNAIQTR